LCNILTKPGTSMQAVNETLKDWVSIQISGHYLYKKKSIR